MAWKIFHIGKANEEIARLESVIADLNKKIIELEAGQKALAENDSDVAKAAAQTAAELDTAKARIKQLETERDQLKADLEAEKKSVDEKAAKKAIEITSAQGQNTIRSGAGKADTGDLEQQLAAIKDPTERTLFFRKHEKEIKAARQAQQR